MKRTKYPIHPDFRRWAHMNPPLDRRLLPLMQRLLGLLFSREKPDRELNVERKNIPGPGGQVPALLYSPRDLPGRAPCLVYYHGGGFALPAAPYHYRLAREYALRCRCRVLFVDYRLAPEHPFPAAPEDCFAAYAWLLKQGEALGVDSARVAVGGDSAGGALAAAVCLMARDRGLALPCGQLLVYPVTGVGTQTESMRQFTDTPMCNSRDIAKYDAFYRPDPKAGNWEYASPLDAASLEGLAPAYIETAEFDCLRDGGLLYAQRLEDSGVPISPDSVLNMLHRVLQRAGLPPLRFHDLRHTFATLALQNGVDIKTVSGMLGHFSAGFTLDTYAHVTTAAQKEAANTMGNILTQI